MQVDEITTKQRRDAALSAAVQASSSWGYNKCPETLEKMRAACAEFERASAARVAEMENERKDQPCSTELAG